MSELVELSCVSAGSALLFSSGMMRATKCLATAAGCFNVVRVQSRAVVAFPFSTAHLAGEVGHFRQHSVDVRHNILAVHDDGVAFGRAQGHVQDAPLLRDIDFVPAKHGIDAGP